MAFFLAFFLLFASGPAHSFYIAPLGIIVCDDREDCLHEMGHRLDHKNGNISQTEAFKFAVDLHRLVSWQCANCRDEFSEVTMNFPGIGSPYLEKTCGLFSVCDSGGWGGYRELYATLYAMANGNVKNLPTEFQPYFDVRPRVELLK